MVGIVVCLEGTEVDVLLCDWDQLVCCGGLAAQCPSSERLKVTDRSL